MAVVKAVKDQSVRRDDIYKSGEIRTGPGEPPSSQSKQTPKGKRIPGKPITSGKLLRPGGPGGAPSKLAHRPAQPAVPISRALPTQRTAAPAPAPQPRPVVAQPGSRQQAAAIPTMLSTPAQRQDPALASILNFGTQGHARNESSASASSARVPPPPPPVAAAKAEDTYKALYDFNGQTETELSMSKDEVIVITQKGDSGTSDSAYSTRPLMITRLVACTPSTRNATRLGTFSLSRGIFKACSTTATASTARSCTTSCTTSKWSC
jgi:myosin-1